MKKFIHLLLALSMSQPAFAVGRIQNEDVKSLADIKSVVSITGNVTNGSACISSPSSLTGLSAGLFVYDSTNSARINSGTTITAIPGTCSAGQIQMSSNAAGSGTGDTITFGGQMSQLINDDKIYIASNSINSQLSTAITNGLLGGAGGTKNYLSNGVVTSNSSGSPNPGNGDFEKNSTSGWSVARTTLSSNVPTSVGSAGVPLAAGTGLSNPAGTIGFSVFSGANVIQKNYSGQLSVAGPLAGDLLISDAFYIDSADKAKMMQIKFSYSNNGATNLNFSGTNANTLSIWIYDVTNATWIQPQGVYNLTQSAGIGQASATFQTSSSGIRYQLAIIENVTAPGAFTMFLDDFQVGPLSAPANGFPASDPVAYTPSLTSSGGGSITLNATAKQDPTGSYQRIGNRARVYFSFRNGTGGAATGTAGTLRVSLPPTLVLDTSQITSTTGIGYALPLTITTNLGGAGLVTTTALMQGASDGYFQIVKPGTGSSYALSDITASLLMTGFVELPVLGWSANTSMSSDTDTRVTAFAGTFSGSQALAGAPGTTIPLTASVDTHGTFASNTYTIPVSGLYRMALSVTNASDAGQYTCDFGYTLNGGSYTSVLSQVKSTTTGAQFNGTSWVKLLNLKAGDALIFKGQSLSNTCTIVLANGTIERLTGPAVVAATETVGIQYTGSSTTVPNSTNTPIALTSKTFDTHGAYSGSTFTTPVSGKYAVSFYYEQQSASTPGGTLRCLILKNGSTVSQAFTYTPTNSIPYSVQCNDVLILNAGDTVQADVFQNGGGTYAAPAGTHLSIIRVGN